MYFIPCNANQIEYFCEVLSPESNTNTYKKQKIPVYQTLMAMKSLWHSSLYAVFVYSMVFLLPSALSFAQYREYYAKLAWCQIICGFDSWINIYLYGVAQPAPGIAVASRGLAFGGRTMVRRGVYASNPALSPTASVAPAPALTPAVAPAVLVSESYTIANYQVCSYCSLVIWELYKKIKYSAMKVIRHCWFKIIAGYILSLLELWVYYF